MACLIWTEPALRDLESIAEYIALDKPDAAQRYVKRVFAVVERLQLFSQSGSIPPELSNLPYRQLVIPPCRIFYRHDEQDIFIVFVMRAEQQFLPDTLIERDQPSHVSQSGV